MENDSITKYGGSSLQRAEQIDLIARITEDDPRRKYLVVSAPGNGVKEKRVTQLLIQLGHLRDTAKTQNNSEKVMDEIVGAYTTIYSPTCEDMVVRELRTRFSSNLPHQAYMANLRALGEELQARLLAETLGYMFVDARECIKLTNDFENGQVLSETYPLIERHLGSQKRVTVIGGFYGSTEDSLIATFSLGGSNKTASILARGLRVSEYENFTDTPIRSAHPELVPDATIIPEMTRKELRALSYYGFEIFHKEALAPLEGTSIALHIRSTEDYPQPGTKVVAERVSDPEHPVVGIAYKKGFAAFSVEKLGLNDEEGILHAVLGVFHQRKIPIEFPETGVDDISIIVEQRLVEEKQNKLRAELSAIAGVAYAEVDCRENLGCIAVAGQGLVDHQRISAEIETTLEEAGINPVADSKGVKKRCFLYAVDQEQGPAAVRVLYDRFMR